MRHTGLVRKSEAAENIAQPAHHLRRRRVIVRRPPFMQRDAVAAVDDHEGPVIVNADVDDRREIRVVEPCGMARPFGPAGERGGIGRCVTRHRQHHLGIEAGIEGQPDHAAGALSQQTPQIQAALKGPKAGDEAGGVSEFAAASTSDLTGIA